MGFFFQQKNTDNFNIFTMYLRVQDLVVGVDPKAGVLGEDLHDLEGLEVVDEDVWQPELVDQLQVDRVEGLRIEVLCEVELLEEGVGDAQARLLPQHVEVGAEGHGVLLRRKKSKDMVLSCQRFIHETFLH